MFYRTRDGTAQAGDDYLGSNNSKVVFHAGATGAALSQTIAIQVKGDRFEGINPETFNVVLTGSYNATVDFAKNIAVGTIVQGSNRQVVTASIANYYHAAPVVSTTIFNVPIILTNLPATQPITLFFSTSDGTAKGGVDYAAVNHGHITIAAGQSSASIPIVIKSDGKAQGDLTFTITLSDPLNAALGTSVATIIIAYTPPL